MTPPHPEASNHNHSHHMSEANESLCPQPGHFGWNELITADAKASADFYGKLFGWQAVPFAPPGAPAGDPSYLLFKTGTADAGGNDMGVAGMMQAPMPGIPTHWRAYVIVGDADTTLAKAVELGAQALLPVMAIPGVGRVAVIQDPLGAVIGIHEPPKQTSR